MLYKIARILQFVGLLILPIAISGNVSEKMSLKDSLMLSSAGMLVFFFGWSLQQSSKPK